MTQQWQLSGNAENVDWSDLAMAGRAYADNLVGEPAVSKVMHMMADEIERLRSVIRPESYAKSDEKRVFYDTKSPQNGALSGCETVPDPDSRVWETPCTPQPHATPTQGSVQGEGRFRVSQNANEPVAWHINGSEYDTGCEYEYATLERGIAEAATAEGCVVVPLYRHPQTTLTDEEREAVEHFAREFKGPRAATLRKLLERLA